MTAGAAESPGSFAARLRACRRSAGLSQDELAEQSGLSVRAIRDLERGHTRWPYPDSLHRLADALELRDAVRAGFLGAASRRLAGAQAPASTGRRADGAAGIQARHRSGRVVPRYLPAAVPAFAGRRDQLATLSRVLQEPGGTAVVTAIGGTAGVGKTALAVYWAHQVAGHFPDGQLFVNLRGFDPSGAPVTPADAVRVFLDALQVPADQLPQTPEAQLGLYRSLLTGKRMLVLLDNARDVSQVRPLLPGSPTCRVVVTSRSQLTGLAAIEGAHSLTLDALSGVEARELLRRRLGAGRADADPGAAARIIKTCAHLPLALTIIAARAALRPDLPLARVAADLDARPGLDAFTDGEDPAADVRAVFSWSYRQLSEDAARLFRLAGLHPGPDLEGYAIAALAGTTPDRAGYALEVLARAGMLQPGRPGRYGLHDLLRGYAGELAAAHDSGDTRAAVTRMLGYYLHSAATAMDTAFPAERHHHPPIPPAATPAPAITDEAAARAWLDAERPNLVAAAEPQTTDGWAGYATYAIRLSTILFRYLDVGAHYPDAIAIHDRARRAARHIGDRVEEAKALNHLGSVAVRQRRYQDGVSYYEQALACSHGTGDPASQGYSHANLGFVLFLQGAGQEAIEHLEQALSLYRATGNKRGEAAAAAYLGFVDLRQGRYEQAAAHLRRSFALYSDAGDRGGEAFALGNLGEVELRQGHDVEAGRHLRQSLALWREFGERSNQADILASLGLIDLRQGRYPQATGHLEQALDLCRETGDQSTEATVLNGLGEVLLATGRPADARARHAGALELASRVGEKYEQARAHDGLGTCYQASGPRARALRHWREAHTMYAGLGAPEADVILAKLSPDAKPRSWPE
jgi:tetratricopeptide (TPR) repeat protein/transcriptional regulator with XRE-family HTH domain